MTVKSTLDVSKVVGDLRDHLARHDKPVAFLFGAGTTCAVGRKSDPQKPLIPAIAGLTEICKSVVEKRGAPFPDGWKKLEENCGHAGLLANIENLLSRVHLIVSALGDADGLLGLTKAQLTELETAIRSAIAKTVNVDPGEIPDDTPHQMFARWITKAARRWPIEIFTVNYDVLFEDALERQRVPYFDGFVGAYKPFFHADTLRRPELAPPAGWTRFWKIHGSVTWRKETIDGAARIIRGMPSDTGEMILPSFEKYDESRLQPYLAFIDRLQRFLEADDALLVTVGFSFSDDHINNVIFEALSHKPRTHVYAMQFADIDAKHVLMRRADVQRNLQVVTPSIGCLGGAVGRWRLDTDLPGSQKFFDRDPQKPGDTKLYTGRLKLGDFRVFCEFLSSFS